MQRIAFVMRIQPGTEAEYLRRHQEIWPEMLAELRMAGAHNYSIYRDGLQLFAYLEVDDLDHFFAYQAQSAVVQRWNVYMSDILVREDEQATGFLPLLSEVFHLD